MKNNRILIIIFSLVFSFACNRSINKFFISKLHKSLESFHPSKVEHFKYFKEKEIKSFRFSFSDSQEMYNKGAFLIAQYNVTNCDSLIKSLSPISINIIQQVDFKNLNLIQYSPISSNSMTDLQIFCDSSKNLIIPNLNFELNDSLNKIDKITDSYTFFIIELSHDCLLEKNIMWDENILPHKWKHGYSRGIAINCKRKNGISWVMLW